MGAESDLMRQFFLTTIAEDMMNAYFDVKLCIYIQCIAKFLKISDLQRLSEMV